MKRRALLSVYHKEGLEPFARGLHELGFELVSTGGTASALQKAGLPVLSVSDVTGFPEILDGRVKTLHPRVHAGILARRGVREHVDTLGQHDIAPIDLVVVNLYPFEATVSRGAGIEEVVENVDVGGPTMLRAAAKNFRDVAPVVDPADYTVVLEQLRGGGIDLATRLYLAQKTFKHTAQYDAAIAAWFAQVEATSGDLKIAEGEDVFPYRLNLTFEKVQDLRYGENPHQRAAFYSDLSRSSYSVASARQLQGKELSFNNLLDLDAAWRLALELPDAGCVVVKHTNPCGVGVGASATEALDRAWACDPTSAFGGIVAFNRRLDGEAAARLAPRFIEVLIAPGFEPAAREALAGKKNLRVMDMEGTMVHQVAGFDLRRVVGGLLVQDWDRARLDRARCDVVSKRKPTDEEWRALELAWAVAWHVKSNAIVLANAQQTVGVGAGQMSRVDAARIAVQKAQLPLAGSAAGSDAFFPFRDGVDELAKAGVRSVIQPGGSVRDDEVVAAANDHDLAMVFTGVRHFRH